MNVISKLQAKRQYHRGIQPKIILSSSKTFEFKLSYVEEVLQGLTVERYAPAPPLNSNLPLDTS